MEISKFKMISPSTALFAGPTSSGKSYLCGEILKHRNEMFTQPLARAIWCYNGAMTNMINDDFIEYHDGIYDIKQIPPHNKDHILIIIDDLMHRVDKETAEIFTVHSHHKNISVFFIAQNIFFKNKFSRDISLNTMYLCLFRQKRDIAQVKTIARQIVPGQVKEFMEIYNECVNKKYGYLMIDLHPAQKERVILRTGILPSDLEIVYIPKNG